MDRTKTITDNKTGEVVYEEAIPGNDNFLMLFRDKMPAIRTLMRRDVMATRVLFAIFENMQHDNCLAASQQTLAEVVGCGIASVNRSIAILKEHGILTTYKMGNATVIAVNSELAWGSYANGKKYAKCKATLLISQDEQTKPRGQRLKFIEAKAETVTGQQTIDQAIRAAESDTDKRD